MMNHNVLNDYSKYLEVEGRLGESLRDYISKIISKGVETSGMVKGSSAGFECFIDSISPTQNSNIITISGKVIDKHNAHWRGKEDHDFSFEYNKDSSISKEELIDMIYGFARPSDELYREWTKTEAGKVRLAEKAKEDKKKEEERKLEEKEHEEKLSGHIKLLDSLDFNNIEGVINWLEDLYVRHGDCEEAAYIVELFEQKGFDAELTNKDFDNIIDKEEEGMAVIQRWLFHLKDNEGTPSIGRNFIKKWR